MISINTFHTETNYPIMIVDNHEYSIKVTFAKSPISNTVVVYACSNANQYNRITYAISFDTWSGLYTLERENSLVSGNLATIVGLLSVILLILFKNVVSSITAERLSATL